MICFDDIESNMLTKSKHVLVKKSKVASIIFSAKKILILIDREVQCFDSKAGGCVMNRYIITWILL